MKRSCESCRASYTLPNWDKEYILGCSLNYNQEEGVPKEPCPKPKTYRRLALYTRLGKDLSSGYCR